MDIEKIENNLESCIEYLSGKTSSRYAFSGSYGLYLNGINLDREFLDIDIYFLDLTEQEVRDLDILNFSPHIHKLYNVPSIAREFVEVDFHGKKVLAFAVQSIIDSKKYQLTLPMTEVGINKQTNDLKFLKEKFNLE